jgi:hypothetical protein
MPGRESERERKKKNGFFDRSDMEFFVFIVRNVPSQQQKPNSKRRVE